MWAGTNDDPVDSLPCATRVRCGWGATASLYHDGRNVYFATTGEDAGYFLRGLGRFVDCGAAAGWVYCRSAFLALGLLHQLNSWSVRLSADLVGLAGSAVYWN